MILGLGSPKPRKGTPSPGSNEVESKRCYREQFFDPAFDEAQAEIDRIADCPWNVTRTSVSAR